MDVCSSTVLLPPPPATTPTYGPGHIFSATRSAAVVAGSLCLGSSRITISRNSKGKLPLVGSSGSPFIWGTLAEPGGNQPGQPKERRRDRFPRKPVGVYREVLRNDPAEFDEKREQGLLGQLACAKREECFKLLPTQTKLTTPTQDNRASDTSQSKSDRKTTVSLVDFLLVAWLHCKSMSSILF